MNISCWKVTRYIIFYQTYSVLSTQVFIGIPILVLLIAVYLVVAPIIESPQIQYLYATLFIVAGVIFYFPFVHYRKVLPGMGMSRHSATILFCVSIYLF